jgi:hypothetical protein
MTWKVAAAKERLSELLRHAEQVPQQVFNRDRLVAVVLGPLDFADFERWRAERKGSVADAFSRLRAELAELDYELPVTPRTTRRNDFLDVLDELPG